MYGGGRHEGTGSMHCRWSSHASNERREKRVRRRDDGKGDRREGKETSFIKQRHRSARAKSRAFQERKISHQSFLAFPKSLVPKENLLLYSAPPSNLISTLFSRRIFDMQETPHARLYVVSRRLYSTMIPTMPDLGVSVASHVRTYKPRCYSRVP